MSDCDFGAATTRSIVLIVVGLLIAWDIWAVYYWGADATISYTLDATCRRHPIIAFAMGLVIGHILWRS